MKLSKLMMVALVALGAVACDKNDGIDERENSPKSITLDLTNVEMGSRSTGSTFESDENITLTNFMVFFSDGTRLLKRASDPHYGFSYTSTTDLETFHFMPADVTEVIVIGNVLGSWNGLEDVTTVADLKKELTLADLKNVTGRSDENLVLYGDGDVTLTEGDVDTEDKAPLYKASVSLIPQMARVEVTEFQCEYLTGSTITSIELQQLVLNNYMTKYTLDAESGTEVQNTQIDNTTIWEFFANATGDYSDALNYVLAKPEGETLPFKARKELTGNALLVYNIFASTALPQFVLKMEDNTKTPLYLVTKNFGDVDKIENGYVYQVQLHFDTDDLKKPEKCVEVSVSVKNWIPRVVVPSFK